MATTSPEGLAARRQRNLESAVLATSTARHPAILTEAELVSEMTLIVNTPERATASKQAVEGLIGVGLLERRGTELVLTAAAIRIAELDLGI